MELSGHGGNNMAAAALDKRIRERERLRRHAVEKPETLPSFAEPPRKINVERQDSLSNKIQDVLGNMDNVHYAMGKDLNIWLGTSRNQSNTNQNSSRSYSGSRIYKAGTTYASPHKSHASANSSSAIPPKFSYPSSSKSNIVHSQNSKSIVGSSQSSSSRLHSSPHSNSNSGAFNSNSSSNLSTKSTNKPSAALGVQVGSRDNTSSSTSNRARRLPSMDMPAAMENIFREMRMQEEEPISEIQTPHVGKEFNFARNETRSKTSINSASHEDADAMNSEVQPSSESDSSDDEDSESDDNDKAGDQWNLSDFMPKIEKPPSEPILNPDPVPKVETSNGYDRNPEIVKSPTPPRSEPIASIKKTSSSAQISGRSSYGEHKETRNNSPIAKDERRADKRNASRSTTSNRDLQRRSHSPYAEQSRKPKNSQTPWSRDHRRSPSSYRHVPSKSVQVPKSKPEALPNSSLQRDESSGLSETLPFSVSNQTVSSEPSNVRQQTGKKGPSSVLSFQQSSYSSHDADDASYPLQDTFPVVSSSSSSSDSDGDASSSSSSDNDGEPASANDNSKMFSDSSSNRTHPRANNGAYFNKNNNQGASVNNKVTSLSDNDVNNSPSYDQNENVRFKNFNNDEKGPRKKPKPSSFQSSKLKKHPMQPPSSDADRRDGYERKKLLKPTVAASPVSQPDKPSRSVKKFQSLWVKLPVFPPTKPASRSPVVRIAKPDHVRNSISSKTSKHRTPSDRLLQNSRCDSTGFSVSLDNYHDQNTRSDDIQVAVAGSSSGGSPNQSRQSKRKYPTADRSSRSPRNQSSNYKSKRRKSASSPFPRSTGNNSSSKAAHGSKQVKKEIDQWKEPKEEYSKQWSTAGDQSSLNNQTNYSGNHKAIKSAAIDSHSSDPGGGMPDPNLAEPDSSWPEQETRFQTSEQFMREGKRLKHEGDSITDSKTGRTRVGESLSRALLYFEASLCFLMNGYMLEMENSVERNDSSRASHSPTSMYNQTISLLDYIKKMRAHDGSKEVAFKRLNISCLRTQALLYLRMYKLKKEIASKYHDSISEHFKPSKSNHIPSPVSPAVPSPYGTVLPGPSPMGMTNSTCEQVSSSTQVKMTSPPTQSGVMLPPKTYEIFKLYHSIMGNLMQAHDKWDQAENLIAEHSDFFRHVDVLRGHSLNLDNSLKDLATYNKVILRQLRGAYKSPKD